MGILEIIGAAIALILGLTIHEFAHAWTANRLGDPTPRWAGRVTLNPIAHLDPIGALMLFLMILGRAPLAWGKPVPINPIYMRWGRRGAALATLAGPLSNVLLALTVALLWRIIHTATGLTLPPSSGATILLGSLMVYNIALAAFNLIPIPPLDGFGILEGLAPFSWERFLAPLRQYGVWILLVLILSSNLVGGFSPLGAIWRPIFEALWSVVVWVAGFR